MQRHAGFTLIELLVGLALLAVLASLSFRGLSAVLDAETHTRTESRRWSDIARVMEQLGRDLSLAVEPPLRDRQGVLLIHRRGESGDDAGLRHVGYRLRDGALEYLAWPVGAGAPPSPVLEHVAALELRILDRSGAWAPLGAQAAESGPLPAAIEARIVLAGGEHVMRLFLLR